MAATWDPELKSDRDFMRLALADTDTANALLQDSTYDALLGRNGYVEGLAQAAQAVLNLYAKDPSVYKDGATESSYDFKDRCQSLRDLISDCRKGLIKPPDGPYRSNAVVVQLAAAHPLCDGPDMTQFRVR